MGAIDSASPVGMLIVLAGILLAFLVEKYLADRFEEPILNRFVLFSLGLLLGLLSLNFFSKLIWRIIGFAGTAIISQGSAAIAGQLIVVTLAAAIQLYISFKIKAPNASFLRGTVISQVIVITRSPGLGLYWLLIIILFLLSLGFSGYHFLAGSVSNTKGNGKGGPTLPTP